MTTPILPVAVRARRAVTFLFPALVGLAAPAVAQQVQPATDQIRLSPEDADRGLNGVQKNFWFAVGAEQEYRNAGFFGQRLRPYIADNAEALSSLNDYRRQKWMFVGERLIFVGAVGLYGQQVLAGDKQQYFNNTQKVAAGVALVSLLSNVLITHRTNEHFMRAVEAHNATLPSAQRMGFKRAVPDLMGVTAPTGRPQLLVGWSLR